MGAEDLRRVRITDVHTARLEWVVMTEDDLRAALERHRFALVATEAAPHTSVGQPKQRLAVMSAPARS